MSRGFLRGLSSSRAPLVFLSDVTSVSATVLSGCEQLVSALSPESWEIFSSSISCLQPSEAEGRVSTSLSADVSVLAGSWGMGEAAELDWSCGGLSLNISPPPPPPPPWLEFVHPSSLSSDPSLSSDELPLLSLEELPLSLLDTGLLVEDLRSFSSSTTIVAATSSSRICSSKSFFCRQAFCNETAKAAIFLDLWI